MFRWQDFTQQEKHELATLCFNLFKSSGNSSIAWVIRSKSSLLMSLVTKRMGQPFWEQLLQELLPYASRGPLEAEKVGFSVSQGLSTCARSFVLTASQRD